MSDDTRTLAVIAGITMLAGPRRTRPLAGFAYGLFLSRAHGAGLRRLEGVVHDVFVQRKSAHARLDAQAESIDLLRERVQMVSAARQDADDRLHELLGALRERVEAIERGRLRVVDGGQG